MNKQASSPRPIHRPSSKPPRHILLLASAFLRKGEKAAAATANLHRHINKDQHICFQLLQAQPLCTGESWMVTAHLRTEVAPMATLAVDKKAFMKAGQLDCRCAGEAPQEREDVGVEAAFTVLDYYPIRGAEDHLHWAVLVRDLSQLFRWHNMCLPCLASEVKSERCEVSPGCSAGPVPCHEQSTVES